MNILVLNAGSSSQKSCLYDLAENQLPLHPPKPLWEGLIDWTHQEGTAEIKVKIAKGAALKEELPGDDRAEVMAHLLSTLWTGETQVIPSPTAIDGVGHRVVHGGERYQDSIRVTSEVKAEIDRLAIFAPVHNPVNLAGIETIEQVLGEAMPQVAVFDTAFHATLSPAAYIYPLPYHFLQQSIRRYGFHGISHQYCAERAAQLLRRDRADLRLVNCHLGNGCSLAAIQGGKSVDTSMGFTPLDGLMMGSRSGSIDPGILIHLLRQQECTVDQLDTMLNRSSGLLGVSQVSADMRQIVMAIAAGNEQAQLALDVYIHRLRSGIGAMVATLGGLDALIFTAGVGENSAIVRAAACQHLGFLGIHLDAAKNDNSPIDQDIATPDSPVRVLVIHTEEDWAIAQECWRLLKS